LKLVPITGRVLAWAIDESGYILADVASKVEVDMATLDDWLCERSQPNTTQFRRLVETLKRPSATFFLPEPPEDTLPPHFRRAAGPIPKDVTADERVNIRWALQLQDVAQSVLREVDAPWVVLPVVASGDTAEQAAATARSAIGLTVDQQVRFKSANEAFAGWRYALEARGVLTLNLPLGDKGIRGFSSAGPLAPMCAVNTAYNFAARTYTLIHELGHLLTSDGSSCWKFEGPGDTNQVGSERWCDRFAADFLLPEDAVRRFVADIDLEELKTIGGASLLGKAFNVSARAVALRLIHLGYAPEALYGVIEAHFQTVDLKAKDTFAAGRTRAARRLAEIGRRGVGVLLEGTRSGSLGGWCEVAVGEHRCPRHGDPRTFLRRLVAG